MSGSINQLCPNEHTVHDLDGKGVRVTCGDAVLAEEVWGETRLDMSDTIRAVINRAMSQHREALYQDKSDADDRRIAVRDARIEALEGLLVCYRIGKQPTEKLHRQLEHTRAALAPQGEGR